MRVYTYVGAGRPILWLLVLRYVFHLHHWGLFGSARLEISPIYYLLAYIHVYSHQSLENYSPSNGELILQCGIREIHLRHILSLVVAKGKG